MKTNPLKILALLLSLPAGAEVPNAFACLRDLMAATGHGSFQEKRRQVEKPFLIDNKYLVFPEVARRKVTGFYLYDRDGAWYYDSVDKKVGDEKSLVPIAELASVNEKKLYQMVAQPKGLETVTLYFVPGFGATETNTSGPVILGTSILPVVGAFVSRPESHNYIYQNPDGVSETRLQEWSDQSTTGRRPAAARQPASAAKIDRQIVSLVTVHPKRPGQLWAPLRAELRLRRDWLKSRNLDDRTFKQLTHALAGSCKE